jgi:HD-GYP domain-containing protein (c-di-GMP phosphodiesterase class II)
MALRILEPLAALSVVTDLAHGRPAEQALRAALLATRVAEQAGESASGRRDALYVTLLRSLGCTATSHEYARWLGGDDIAVRREGDRIDPTSSREGLGFVRRVARDVPISHRLGVLAVGATRGPRIAVEAARADCEVAQQLGVRLGLSDQVTGALFQGFERWDGRGHPQGLAGDTIHLSARIAAAASALVMFEESLGAADAASILRRWAGRALDPDVVGTILAVVSDTEGEVHAEDPLAALLAAEPHPVLESPESRMDDVAVAFAMVGDLKATHLHGHSTGVARVAERAARLRGRPDDAVTTVRRAALLHDLGRAAVPTGIWERPGRLSNAEWERVRLHAYQTERILARSSALTEAGRIAAMHHERIDGSGYHRGSRAAEQDGDCRLLAVADVYSALTESRPHRPAFSPDAAAHTLREMALDPECVECVLEAAGQTRRRIRTRPAGLTEREVDVLRLIVRGMSMGEVAAALHISTSTVHTHLAHVYEKAGISTRAAAAVFAMEHDLLDPELL